MGIIGLGNLQMQYKQMTFQVCMEADEVHNFREILFSQAADTDDIIVTDNECLFSSGTKVQFIPFLEDASSDVAVFGLTISVPQQLYDISMFLQKSKTPIQITQLLNGAESGEITIIPTASEKEFGKADPNLETYSFDYLIAQSRIDFIKMFSLGEDESEPDTITIENLNHQSEADIFEEIAKQPDEVVRSQYKYIIIPQDISVEKLIFEVLGLTNLTTHDPEKEAYFRDDSRQIRLSAYRINYEDGEYWDISIFAPDQGVISEASITKKMVQNASKFAQQSIQIFATISEDELAEVIVAQEFFLLNGQIISGQFRNFIAAE